MGTLTTIFMIASLILAAITMFAGFMGIVGPRRKPGEDGGEPHRWSRKHADPQKQESTSGNRRDA